MVTRGAIDEPIRIIILDSYALIRAGLRLIIESDSGMKVIGDTGDWNLGLEMVAQQKPDIVLLNLNASGGPGLDVIPRLLESCCQTRVILMTMKNDFQICSQAIQMGVSGVVEQLQPPQVLLKAIKKVHCGEVWFERSLMANFLISLSPVRHQFMMNNETKNIAQLSDREREVIQLIGEGLKNKIIADKLCIGETTVRHHLTSIYNKLGVSDRLELLVYALGHGLIKPKM